MIHQRLLSFQRKRQRRTKRKTKVQNRQTRIKMTQRKKLKMIWLKIQSFQMTQPPLMNHQIQQIPFLKLSTWVPRSIKTNRNWWSRFKIFTIMISWTQRRRWWRLRVKFASQKFLKNKTLKKRTLIKKTKKFSWPFKMKRIRISFLSCVISTVSAF